MRLIQCVWLLCLALPSVSYAQALISRNLVNGRMVEVYDDHTWQYEDDVSNICLQTSDFAKVCGYEPEWTIIPNVQPGRYADFYYDELNTTRFLTLGIGEMSGLTRENLARYYPEFVAGSLNLTIDEIEVIKQFDSEISHLPAVTLILRTNFDGINVIYYMTAWVGESAMVEIMLQNYASEVTPEALDLFSQFVSKVEIEAP